MGVANTRAIDIHHHYVPPALLEESKRHGKALGVELVEKNGEVGLAFEGGGKVNLNLDLMDIERRLQMMAEHKIVTASLIPDTPCLGYRLDGQRGESWSRLYNEGLHDLVQKHPDKFVALACLPLQDPPRAAKVLEHAVRELNFRGAYVASNTNGKYYNSQEFDPFWRKAEELNVLVVMHPEDVAGSERMDAYGLRLVCGNPADSTLSLGYITYGGVFDRFPNLKLCVLHGGGFFAFQLGRFDHGFTLRFGPRSVQASSPPSKYLKNLYFDTLVFRVDALEFLRRIAGADHLMLGTDYPFRMSDRNAVEKVEALDCSESDKQAILSENAKRLLKL
jgi:aminocarboxymuconate-semialdehyde decarboxylase